MLAHLKERQLNELLTKLGGFPKTRNAYHAAVLALSTGAKAGEIAGLRFSDVNWNSSTVRIRDLKKGTYRLLPIPAELHNVLVKRRKAANGVDLVFGKDATRLLSAAARMLSRVAKSLGMEGVTFRTLRHNFARTLVAQGIPYIIIWAALGLRSGLQTTSNPSIEDIAEILRTHQPDPASSSESVKPDANRDHAVDNKVAVDKGNN